MCISAVSDTYFVYVLGEPRYIWLLKFGKIVPPNLPPTISDHPDKTSEKFRNFEELYLR